MQARMNNPAMIVPEAMRALQALAKATEKGGVPSRTRDLVTLRASQINGWNRLNVSTKQVAVYAGFCGTGLFDVG